MSLIVKTEQFTKEDFIELLLNNLNVDLGTLKMYNKANYFVIKKVYNKDILSGYAVVFLGHNGLESNDASIEEIEAFTEESLQILINSIKSKDGFPIFIEDIYYDPTKYSEELNEELNKNGFNAIGRTR